MRRTVLALAVYSACCFGQTPAAPAFEVAIVKVSHEPPGSDASKSTPGSIWMRNMTLRAIAGEAYNVPESKVLGGPKWLDDERFDIDAKSAGPAGSQLWVMMQTLLAERFQLTLHRETKNVSGYSLVVAKGGLKMQPAKAVAGGKPSLFSHNGTVTASQVSMADLAKSLARRYRIQVADATGVSDVFDFKADLPEPEGRGRPEEPKAADVASDPASSAAALSRALEELLGVKLLERKVPVEFLVIDRAEKPVEQ